MNQINTHNRHFLVVFGKNRKDIISNLQNYLDNKVIITNTNMCTYFVNNIYYSGLPDKPIIVDNVELFLQGLVFPYNVTLDEFSEQPERYHKEMIEKHRNDLTKIPYSIRNGSYCGVAYDETDDAFYAFTCFLNSIPLYYSQVGSCLVVSNDLCLIAQLLNLELKVSKGLLEYYVLGTNVSEYTAFDEISAIPKGGYLKFKGNSITIDYYYTMPTEEKPAKKFDDYVDEFAAIWDDNVNALHSDKFVYGFGLTGGIDSRLIFSAVKNKSKPIIFTGSHPEHPDYLIAKKITESLKLNNHYLEDYRFVDSLTGYAEYCSMSDNPLLANTIYTSQQMKFRQEHNILYELIGRTELIGGRLHYRDMRNILSPIKRSLPLKRTPIKKSSLYKLIKLGLRNQTFDEDINLFGEHILNSYPQFQMYLQELIMPQIGICYDEETFLERFRHIYHFENLLSWTSLSKRRIDETLAPSMNMDMTNFTCKIPLEFREEEKIFFAYFKRYNPQIGKFVRSHYIFSANSPWIIYKLLSNYIKSLNAIGIKIPFLQWYIKNHSFPDLEKQPEVKEFQKKICSSASIIKDSIFNKLFLQYSNDSIRLMRLFNIAILQMRLEKGEDNLKDFLVEQMNNIRTNKINK